MSILISTPSASRTTVTTAPAPQPTLLRRQSTAVTYPAPSCSPWLNLENLCAAATSNFALLTAFASQAPCLCYSSSTWAPDVYDSALATCLSYLSTASPAYYTSSIDGPNLPRTPCLNVASIVGPDASGATSSLLSAASDHFHSACLSCESISSICNAKTPGFASLSISAKGNCLCFTSGTYAPSIFDDYWASCLTYYSTASPAIYSSNLSGNASVRLPCVLFEPTRTFTGSKALQTTHTATTAMASSGAGVTSLGPSSTSKPLTTAAAAKTASTGGGRAAQSVDQVSVIGVLLLGVLAIAVVL